MAYHCTLDTAGCATACDCPLLPLGGAGDVVDEALFFFRANVLFRSFDILGGGDKLLLYISLYLSHCLQRACVPACVRRRRAQRRRTSLAPGGRQDGRTKLACMRAGRRHTLAAQAGRASATKAALLVPLPQGWWRRRPAGSRRRN